LRRILAYPLRFLDQFLDRIIAGLGAILLAQFPQYFGQYLQRLGGHLNELRHQVAEYEEAAAALGLTLNEYIDEHLQAGSEIFVSTGQIIVDLVERLAQMETAFAALTGASLPTRWLVFISQADWSIAAETWRHFTPGVPTTVEGLIYAGAGLLLGWGLYTLFKALCRPFIRLFGTKDEGHSP
jgi:hypothetical protein